jgi:hypothetical protein
MKHGCCHGLNLMIDEKRKGEGKKKRKKVKKERSQVEQDKAE